MLKSVKDRATVSILEKLKQKGMPASMSPVPAPMGEEEFQQEPEYEEADPMGQTIQAPALSKATLLRKKRVENP